MSTKIQLTSYRTSDYLTDDELIFTYLGEIFKDGDAEEILHAIGEVTKAKGITHIAKLTGLSRESLYKSFRAGAKPRFETILKIINAFGAKLTLA